ncbi:MAG: hypothetical protein AB7V04_03745 [Desulfomonilaceae bacterium]
MRVFFYSGLILSVLCLTVFSAIASGPNPSTQAIDSSKAINRQLDSAVYMMASLDEKNSRLCHMVEETPVCLGMAPQKSQTADNAIKSSLSSSQIKNSEASKTFLPEK